MDLSGVDAVADKACSALVAGRVARSAELFGRAVAAAQALRQPDCLVVAFLQCLHARALLATASLPETDDMVASTMQETATCAPSRSAP